MSYSEAFKDDLELLELVFQWQGNPQKYTDLLMDQIYPTLKRICKKEVANFYKDSNNLPTSATSLVNEIYLDIRNNPREKLDELESLRDFYMHLRQIMRAVLIDRQRQILAKKRSLENKSNIQARSDYKYHLTNRTDIASVLDVNVFDENVDKLRQIEPNVAEALSFRFYTDNSIEQIAVIMDKHKSSVQRYLSEGRKILEAMISGVEIPA